jgi:hypothetical protein
MHAAGGELEQIQFLLGHVSVATTERYLGWNQRLQHAVNDQNRHRNLGRRFHPMDDGHPEPNVPVGQLAGECEAGYADRMAAPRISVVLALEVQTNGKTAPTQAPSAVDPRDGR